MTTTIPPSEPEQAGARDPRLVWAEETLELSDARNPAQARAGLLRALADENFLPAERWSEAARVLFHQQQGTLNDEFRAGPGFDSDERETLSEQIDALASDWMSLTPAERLERWQPLWARGLEYPPIRSRLLELRAAIESRLDTTRLPDEQARQLVQWAQELFPLRPLARSGRRAEIVRQTEPHARRWQVVAKRVQREHADLVPLAPELFAALADGKPWQQPKQVKLGGAPEVAWRMTETRPEASLLGFLGSPMLRIGAVVVIALIGLISRSSSPSLPRRLPALPPSSVGSSPKYILTPEFIERNPEAARLLTGASEAEWEEMQKDVARLRELEKQDEAFRNQELTDPSSRPPLSPIEPYPVGPDGLRRPSTGGSFVPPTWPGNVPANPPASPFRNNTPRPNTSRPNMPRPNFPGPGQARPGGSFPAPRPPGGAPF